MRQPEVKKGSKDQSERVVQGPHSKAGASSLQWGIGNICKSRTYITQIGKWRGLQQRDNFQQVT